jgi:NADH:ubiquinone oxidoreductase subunit E
MLIVQICVGSSCYLKGSADIVELFEKNIEIYGLQNEIVLVGSFCMGKCNRVGVTIQVNDDVHVGITKETFKDFFEVHILKAIKKGE